MKGHISFKELLASLEAIPGREVKLSSAQAAIVEHGDGPLWVIAGPGSGKTEVLVLRCLKLVLVDGVSPKSIMITTFTEKAARNLQDRLTTYKLHIAKEHPEIADIDLFQLRVGTLHSLCNTIMLEYRYPGYRNYRPLDDMEQLLFIYAHSELARAKPPDSELEFWKQFRFTLEGRGQWALEQGMIPSRWVRAKSAQSLFNRIVEDAARIEKMIVKGGSWKRLAAAYMQYENSLDQNYRVDFAHMQSKFLDFLDSPLGQRFLNGAEDGFEPGLRYVLVDEYQDTNPVQEAIYFKLGGPPPHNLCVVGDDDQALYRFRGGTVESLINFDRTCKRRWDLAIEPTPLVENYRSHPKIVEWCNNYIESFKLMRKPGARVPGKPPLRAKSSIDGSWPAVGIINAKKTKELAKKFADTIHALTVKNVLNIPSDCVLLMRSTRETRTWAGPYVEALRAQDIPVYNPRSRKYLDQEEVQVALGALLEILDPNPTYATIPNYIQEEADKWRESYKQKATKGKSLLEYVKSARKAIEGADKAAILNTRLQDLLFHVLNQDPFTKWLDDPERTVRLGQLTQLLEAFCSTPIPDHPGLSRGLLKTSKAESGKISWEWRTSFYHTFISLICDLGLNDPEDPDEIYPSEMMPVMTVHQAKGLEFPFVFVGKLDETAEPETSHIMEERFREFRDDPPPNLPSAAERAKQDIVRFYFVAYSRARYALILLARDDRMSPGESDGEYLSLGGRDVKWLGKYVKVL